MKVSDSLGRKEIGGRVCESWLHIRGDVIGLVGGPNCGQTYVSLCKGLVVVTRVLWSS